MQSLILSHLLYLVYYKDNALENVLKRSWEQCELGDLGAIEFGVLDLALILLYPKRLRLLPCAEARIMLLKTKNSRP